MGPGTVEGHLAEAVVKAEDHPAWEAGIAGACRAAGADQGLLGGWAAAPVRERRLDAGRPEHRAVRHGPSDPSPAGGTPVWRDRWSRFSRRASRSTVPGPELRREHWPEQSKRGSLAGPRPAVSPEEEGRVAESKRKPGQSRGRKSVEGIHSEPGRQVAPRAVHRIPQPKPPAQAQLAWVGGQDPPSRGAGREALRPLVLERVRHAGPARGPRGARRRGRVRVWEWVRTVPQNTPAPRGRRRRLLPRKLRLLEHPEHG